MSRKLIYSGVMYIGWILIFIGKNTYTFRRPVPGPLGGIDIRRARLQKSNIGPSDVDIGTPARKLCPQQMPAANHHESCQARLSSCVFTIVIILSVSGPARLPDPEGRYGRNDVRIHGTGDHHGK